MGGDRLLKSKWLVLFISFLLLISILLAVRLSSNINLIEKAKGSAGDSFASDMLHFIYYSQLKMIGREQQNPDQNKEAFMVSLRMLGELNFSPATQLEESMNGRIFSIEELSSLEGDEFILQLAIMYPLTQAYSNAKLIDQNRLTILESLTEFKEIYIDAVGKLNEYHRANGNFRGINYTVKTYEGKTAHKGNTKELLSEEKRIELRNILSEVSSNKENIVDAIFIIEFEL